MRATTWSEDPASELMVVRERLKNWLVRDALPLWAEAGYDAQSGRFSESLTLETAEPSRAPARPRVPPRQIYSFLEGARLGWPGDAASIATRGLAAFHADFLQGDGSLRPLAADGSRPFDLYDQAFALFAYASIAGAVAGLRETAVQEARRLRDLLVETLAHPDGGFEENAPRRLPLRANPNMHLFEAALAWEHLSGSPRWGAMARGLAELAMSRFIDPDLGMLREYYEGDWSPAAGEAGHKIDPGHLFEWCWLLTVWGRRTGRNDALAAAARLYAAGMRHGICPDRGVVMLEIGDDLRPREPVARLWSQTEWLKASLVMMEEARKTGDAAREREAAAATVSAARVISSYLDVEPRGLWRDRLAPDGRFVEEPAPASSLYHLVCAVAELDRVCG
ncbi:AGE family epimerase/isomerase [Stappia sp. WLB 29]|uniref:AGE family epimerase/isomerase n=1 Tax=Stappia sp. WLB 29 TaxID=2925220 RepID=UPI0020C046E6|nr:AGE family epimerase/isomerase [Stappia sp. WLB 29]